MESTYLYLGLMIFTLSYPLAQSFEWRLTYYKKWKFLWPGILIMCGIFIPWDIWFTAEGVWWFNHKYTLGIDLFGLPIEEWMFFILVPFACIFIYEVLNYFVKKDVLRRLTFPLLLFFSVFFIGSAIMFSDQLYTLTAGLFSGALALLLLFRNPKWASRFLLMYLVSWIPFLFVNGALTGTFTSDAVVNYNPDEFLGIRVLTIPIEDSIYNFGMLLTVTWVYEWRKSARMK